MTANQLIALLEIHRTEKTCLGTIGDDLRYLLQRKLVERPVLLGGGRFTPSPTGDLWVTTQRGAAVVAEILFHSGRLCDQ